MFATMKTRFAASLARLFPAVARRFVRHQRGGAAVETALVMGPFLALLAMTMETAVVFFAQNTLDTAVARAGRLVMTGQAQTFDAAAFKKAICDQNYVLIDCAEGLHVDVKTYSSFASVDPKVEFDKSGNPITSFDTGGNGDIVVARLMYNWPIISPLTQEFLANPSHTSRWLVATTAFRNEPF